MKYFVALLLTVMTVGCATGVVDPEDKLCPSVTDKSNIECFESTVIKVYAEDSFPEERKMDLAIALSDWSIKTDNRVRFDLIFVPKSVLKDADDIQDTYFVFNRAPSDPKYDGFCHWRDKIGAVIEIKPDLRADLFEPVALHEFGHALGLRHYEGKDPSIMHPNLHNGFEITCLDVKNFCDMWGCGANECTKNDTGATDASNE